MIVETSWSQFPVLHQSLNLLAYEGLILQVDLSNLFFFFFQNHIIHTIGVLLSKFELLRLRRWIWWNNECHRFWQTPCILYIAAVVTVSARITWLFSVVYISKNNVFLMWQKSRSMQTGSYQSKFGRPYYVRRTWCHFLDTLKLFLTVKEWWPRDINFYGLSSYTILSYNSSVIWVFLFLISCMI